LAWNPHLIDWLALTVPDDYAQALTDLFSSNPVLNASRTRPTLHTDLSALYRSAMRVAQEELQFALDNAGRGGAFQTSKAIQDAVINGVTKYLMSEHYNFEITQPRPQRCRIVEGQIWYPASYYVVRRFVGKRFYRHLTFLGWEDDIPQRDFYGDANPGTRHPAVIVSERADGAYWMIPISHSRKGFPVDLGDRAPRQRFAQHNFPFVASWAMLERDNYAHNVRRLRIRTNDLISIKQSAMRYIDAVELRPDSSKD